MGEAVEQLGPAEGDGHDVELDLVDVAAGQALPGDVAAPAERDHAITRDLEREPHRGVDAVDEPEVDPPTVGVGVR